MPKDKFGKDHQFLQKSELLTYEEIIEVVKILKRYGLEKVRLTGGEPMLRKNIELLIKGLKDDALVNEVSITTNGSLLDHDKIRLLKTNGLDAITISIQPFDKTVIDDIEKAILDSDLGFNPSNNGNSIMITFPPLSAERRQELVKVASKIIEDGRISVRNIRREIIQSAKRIEDEQNISEDNMKTFLDDIQEVTDSFITRLNALQKEKDVEILDK